MWPPSGPGSRGQHVPQPELPQAQAQRLLQLRQRLAAAQAAREQLHSLAKTVPAAPASDAPDYVAVFEVSSDFLEKEGERVVSALGGSAPQRAWALNVLCLLSFRQELRLGAFPGLLAALLPVLQEGLTQAVGISQPQAGDDGAAAAAGPLPRSAGKASAASALFPDLLAVEEGLSAAAAAAVVLRNAAEVQQNVPLLVDPPVMRCWTWALDAARELVQQQAGEGPEAAAGPGSDDEGGDGGGGRLCVGGGTAADVCTSILQMATALSGRMLLPAFFECGLLLLRSLLVVLRPSWPHGGVAAGGAVLPPPLVAAAAVAVTAVGTAYQPNTEILLSMTGAAGGSRPGSALMQVVADLLACPFAVFRRHCERTLQEESPGWRCLLPSDWQLLAEARRLGRAVGGGGTAAAAAAARDGPDRDCTSAELCTVDMLGVLSQLRYLAALLHLLWRLLTADGAAGAAARRAAAGCPHLLTALFEVAVHRWPRHPSRWHPGGHTRRHADAYPAYLRFLSHDLMPAMRERQGLLGPLRADAAALLALLAADPETRAAVAWCEGQLATAVMAGVVPSSEPGISALLARFAAKRGDDPSAQIGGLAATQA